MVLLPIPTSTNAHPMAPCLARDGQPLRVKEGIKTRENLQVPPCGGGRSRALRRDCQRRRQESRRWLSDRRAPSSVAIANGEFDRATGYKIDFRRFNSGAEIFAAIASGDVQVGYVGSSPFAAATSRGLDVKAFYLASISGIDEALVVRNGSGINSLDDLKGKKLAAAPVSTDHYQLLALIKSLGLTEKDVQVFAIPQPDIVAGYNRGDLDGGFVWDPALTELKKNGKVLVTSKDVADKGAPTFSAWVATIGFAKDNPDFLKSFSGVIAKYQTSFANDKPPGDRTATTPRSSRPARRHAGGSGERAQESQPAAGGRAALRRLARRRREVGHRQDPQGHRELPEGAEEDLRGAAVLCGLRDARRCDRAEEGRGFVTTSPRLPQRARRRLVRRRDFVLEEGVAVLRVRQCVGLVSPRATVARFMRSINVSLEIPDRRLCRRARNLRLRQVDPAQRHGGFPASVRRVDHA